MQGSDFRQLFFGAEQEPGIGGKTDVPQRKVRRLFLQVFELSPEDVLAGGQPKESRIGMVLDQLEGYVALARPGGMDHGRFAVLLQHGCGSLIRPCIVFKQVEHHPPHPLPHQGGILHSENGGYLLFLACLSLVQKFYHSSAKFASGKTEIHSRSVRISIISADFSFCAGWICCKIASWIHNSAG